MQWKGRKMFRVDESNIPRRAPRFNGFVTCHLLRDEQPGIEKVGFNPSHERPNRGLVPMIRVVVPHERQPR